MTEGLEEFTPPVPIRPSGSYLVIHRLEEGQRGEIIRILHAHQNLMAYLTYG